MGRVKHIRCRYTTDDGRNNCRFYSQDSEQCGFAHPQEAAWANAKRGPPSPSKPPSSSYPRSRDSGWSTRAERRTSGDTFDRTAWGPSEGSRPSKSNETQIASSSKIATDNTDDWSEVLQRNSTASTGGGGWGSQTGWGTAPASDSNAGSSWSNIQPAEDTNGWGSGGWASSGWGSGGGWGSPPATQGNAQPSTSTTSAWSSTSAPAKEITPASTSNTGQGQSQVGGWGTSSGWGIEDGPTNLGGSGQPPKDTTKASTTTSPTSQFKRWEPIQLPKPAKKPTLPPTAAAPSVRPIASLPKRTLNSTVAGAIATRKTTVPLDYAKLMETFTTICTLQLDLAKAEAVDKRCKAVQTASLYTGIRRAQTAGKILDNIRSEKQLVVRLQRKIKSLIKDFSLTSEPYLSETPEDRMNRVLQEVEAFKQQLKDAVKVIDDVENRLNNQASKAQEEPPGPDPEAVEALANRINQIGIRTDNLEDHAADYYVSLTALPEKFPARIDAYRTLKLQAGAVQERVAKHEVAMADYAVEAAELVKRSASLEEQLNALLLEKRAVGQMLSEMERRLELFEMRKQSRQASIKELESEIQALKDQRHRKPTTEECSPDDQFMDYIRPRLASLVEDEIGAFLRSLPEIYKGVLTNNATRIEQTLLSRLDPVIQQAEQLSEFL